MNHKQTLLTASDSCSPAYKAGKWLFIVTALYYLSFSSYGINLWDEGGIYAGGLRYLDGQSVHKDFFGYQPGRYLLVEAVFRIFGTEMLPVRYVFALLSGLFGVFAFQICRRLMPPIFAAPAVLLVISAPAVYYQRFYGFGFLFSAWAVMAYLKNGKNFLWIIAAGIYAYLFRPELLAVMLPVYLYLLWIRREDLRKRFFVALCLAALVLIAFNVSDFLLTLENHYGRWSNPFPVLWEGYQGGEFGLLALLENSLFYLPFISGVCLIAFALKRDDVEKKRLLFVLGYLQLAAMSLVIIRAGFDNLVRCLPLFFIAVSYIAFRAVRFPALRPAGRAALAAMLLLLWISYMAVFNVANGFYSGSIGAVLGTSVQLKGGRADGIRARRGEAEIISGVTEWIKTSTGPEESILALPLNPLWYFMAGRRNPTRYDWVLPDTLSGDEKERNMIRRLDANPPALVAFVDIEIDNKPQRRLKNYAPLLLRWMVDNYEYSGSVAYFQMWERKK